MKKLIIALLLITSSAFGQDRISDSLKLVLEHTHDDTVKVNVYIKLCSRMAAKDSVVALACAANAIKLSENAKFYKGKVKALYAMADVYEGHLDISATGKCYRKGIAYALETKQDKLACRGYKNYGVVLKQQRDYKQALLYYDSALVKFTAMNDSEGLEGIYNNIGNVYNNQGRTEEAIKSLLKSLNIAQLRKSDIGMLRAYANISSLYAVNGNHQLSLENALKSLEPAKRLGDSIQLMSIYQTVGASYANTKDYGKALEYMRPAYAYFKDIGDKQNMMANLPNIASALNGMHQYKEAITVTEDGIRLARELDDSVSLGYSLWYAGTAHHGLKEDKVAEKCLLDALAVGKIIEEPQLTMNVLAQLSILYEDEGNYKKALDYNVALSDMKDSIFTAEKNKTISELQVKYETEKKETELAKSKQAIAESNLVLNRKNNLLIVYGLLAAILGISIIFIFRNARLERKRLEKENILEMELANAAAENKMQEEKLRISRELHDNIGSQLTFINSSLENIRHGGTENNVLTDTQKLTLNAIRELRSTVWLINQSEFLLDDFAIKLREFVKPLKNSNVDVDVTLSGSGLLKLPAATATHIFRIIQEGINNALKYSGCTLLTIALQTTDDKLTVSIRDNGAGFDISNVTRGFGLKNIKARTDVINAICNFESAAGRGTTITVIIPVA